MHKPQHREIVLPVPGERNVLITSALPYVNNVPHLGNIIGSVLSADVFARYCRGRGVNTLYVCGTDEYGTTSETKAVAEGCTPQELCDKYHSVHAEVYEWFRIGFDVFGRTTTKLQTEIAQSVFLKLHRNGFLREQCAPQLYCQVHGAFLADRLVEGECPACGDADARGDQCDGCGRLLEPMQLRRARCKIDGSTPIVKETKHVFLDLLPLRPAVEAFCRESAAWGAWSEKAQEITNKGMEAALQPRSITRDLTWGTAVPLLPGYEDKVMYQWFDACLGYVSITAGYTDQWLKWWRDPDNVQLYQFMGKDNVIFHSVIFPATQMGTKEPWTKLHHLSATDYLTYEGGKFSKSRGIGVFGDSARKTGVAADVWRYYLLSHRPETGETEFSWDSFIECNNRVLRGTLDDFVGRVLQSLHGLHYQAVVPVWSRHIKVDFIRNINKLVAKYNQELEAVQLRAGLLTAVQIAQAGLSLLQTNEVDGGEKGLSEYAAVTGLAVNLVHLLASLIAPYMPDTAEAINLQLGAGPMRIPDEWHADSIKAGHVVRHSVHLFEEIKPEKAETWRGMFGSGERQKAKHA